MFHHACKLHAFLFRFDCKEFIHIVGGDTEIKTEGLQIKPSLLDL